MEGGRGGARRNKGGERRWMRSAGAGGAGAVQPVEGVSVAEVGTLLITGVKGRRKPGAQTSDALKVLFGRTRLA